MSIEEFVNRLRTMTPAMILAAADDLEVTAASAAGEVTWWRATVEIDRLLRLHHAGRRAAMAASQAASAVVGAARAAGLDVTDVARGLAAESGAVDDLLRGCRHLLAA
jgi:hypothetical protein